MPFITVNGTSIHYVERGTGPVVVLLHGFPLDYRAWIAQMDALSIHYRVLSPDFRGFGQSASTDEISMESLADDTQSLLSALSASPAVVAGLSMGGYVALAMAKKYPQALRGLILADTKAAPDTTDAKEGRRKMIALAQEKGAAAVADAMLPRLLSPDTLKNKPAIVKRMREMTDQCPPLTIVNALTAMRDRPDLTPALPGIAVPTLLLVGEADVITPPAVMQEMARLIPRSQVAIVRSSGHMPMMEQPEQTSIAMRQFLDGIK